MTFNSDKDKKRPEKNFRLRDSLFTEYFNNPSTRIIYSIYLVGFTALMVYRFVKTGSLDLGLIRVVKLGFKNFDKVVLIWLCYFLLTCASFFVFRLWANVRNVNKRMCDWFCGLCLTMLYYYSFKLTTDAVLFFELNPPGIGIVTVELPRILMKLHSFVRNNALKVTSPNFTGHLPTFSHFLYFLFVPTLIYADSYPSTEKIRWKFVGSRFLECLSHILILASFSELMDPFSGGFHRLTLNEIILLLVTKAPVGALMLVSFFFLLFHSWQNMFAEITRFGDRHFYSDWWNACSLGTWMKKWNLIVHPWLYRYIYLDFKQHVYDNTVVAKFMVFLVSLVVHEWVMYNVIGGLFPLGFFQILLIVLPNLFFKVPEHFIFNVALLLLGSLMVTADIFFYWLEYYAISNSPLENYSFWEIPRFVTCDCIIALS